MKTSSVEDDDQEWDKIQRRLNKREVLEGKSKTSHSVHCPQFPYDKQEYWWTYICDRNSLTLLTAPFHVTNLIDDEDFQLKVSDDLKFFFLFKSLFPILDSVMNTIFYLPNLVRIC